MANIFKSTVAALCLTIATPVVPAMAQGVPTIDTQNLTQQITQIRHMLDNLGIQTDQLDTLLEQVTLLEDQFAQLESIYAALTGPKDIIPLLMGGDLDCLLKRDFTGLLSTLEAGMRTGDWASLIEDSCSPVHKSIEQVWAESGFPGGKVQELAASENPGAQRIAQQATAGAMVAAAAEGSYARAGASAQRLDMLVAAIPEEDDVKAAVDHNTRVTAEVGIIILQLLELQAMQTVGDGITGVTAASQQAEEKKFMDLTIPEMR